MRSLVVPSPTQPTAEQVRVTRDVARWYLARFYRRPDDPGVPKMFADQALVGPFAIDLDALRDGDDAALFRLLVTTAMFQRRQDVQIMRILRGISSEDASELSSASSLEALVRETSCDHVKSNRELLQECDLAKDAQGRGVCAANPSVSCHLKRHTVLLKRYGHFGKVPTSIALNVRENGGSLGALREGIFKAHRGLRARAVALETALSGAWRVNQKIASMFLAAVTNPDLLQGAAWSRGLDWRYFVVVDSNVDLFLASIRYQGSGSYDARRAFVIALARQIDLRTLSSARVRAFNPRLVQQAMYLFMSVTNRRALATDCSREGPAECARCPRTVRDRCGLRVDVHRA